MANTDTPPGIRDDSRRWVSNKVFQDEGRFVKYSCETNGEYTECILLVRPSGGNPMHYHKLFTETFTPISGTIGVDCASDTIHLDPFIPKSYSDTANDDKPHPQTTSFTVPRHARHRFFNPSDTDPIRFHVKLAPGNLGFEKSIYVAYGLANDGLTDEEGLPNNFLHLCVLAGLGDISIAGGGWVKETVMAWVVKLGYAVARWTGVERGLLERYWL